MNSYPLVSIVIPCYNDAQYIEQSVQSALNQTYLNTEIIIVDDGSNAETKAVLKKLQLKITKLITQENQGQSTARNVGIKAAKGDFILVLDSDDYFEASFCEEAVNILQTSVEVKIVTCQALLLYSDNRNELYIPKGGDIKNFMYANCALGTSMFKKKDWESVSGYDQNMRTGFEDWEFFIRLLKLEGTAFVIQKPLYTYRKRETSTTAKANRIQFDLLHFIYTKHQDLYVSDFDAFISFLLNKIKKAETTRYKYKSKIDYQLGTFILKPIRVIKSFFK
ncbi:glycosyltransferase family 2 protein [Flavobacterium sp.]|uniref:glycosyltransferase family 2 protein n=1 Tax=Flavobacterium sp. TaxID=239 RepID=UPI004048CBC1